MQPTGERLDHRVVLLTEHDRAPFEVPSKREWMNMVTMKRPGAISAEEISGGARPGARKLAPAAGVVESCCHGLYPLAIG